MLSFCSTKHCLDIFERVTYQKLICLLYLKIGQMEQEHLEKVLGGILEGYLVKGKICCFQLHTDYPWSAVTGNIFYVPL